MKRGLIILSLCAVAIVAYFTSSKWAIHHKTLTFEDPARNDRPVIVDVAVRRDREMEAMADMIELPVAIVSPGNSVRNTEYSFLTNLFAARGHLVVSVQHDLATDDPMVTKIGEEYVGRRMQYNRGIFNIKFAIKELQKLYPKRGLSSPDPDRALEWRRHLDVFRQAASRDGQEGRHARQSARAFPDRRQDQDPVVPLERSRVPGRSRRRSRRRRLRQGWHYRGQNRISAQRFERSRPRQRQGIDRGKGARLPRRRREGVVPVRTVDGSSVQPVGSPAQTRIERDESKLDAQRHTNCGSIIGQPDIIGPAIALIATQ
jgi:hypothetical protein